MTILDTRRFLRQKLLEFNSELEVRSGSAIGTMLLKPMSVLTNPTEEEIAYIRTQLSLEDVSSLGTENVDRLIANLFLERRVGNIARGTVRLYFATAQDSLVPQGTGFLDRTGQLFLANTNVSISQSEMSLNRSGSQYYMDVFVTASSPGDSYNVDADEIVSSESEISGVIRITNPSPLTSGLDTETDAEYVERAGTAITVRNLINRRSIDTVLLEQFNFITSLQAIGFRDPEMIRDLIQVNLSVGLTDLNIGGHADIYIESTDESSTSVDIPDTAMDGNLVISTNADRGLISESVVPGLFIDIEPGFFGEFELERQQAVSLNPSSTYYIYLDSVGVLQLDDIGGVFPSNSIPLAIVTTTNFAVDTITDSRQDLIEFDRPMILIDSVVELDPLTGTETERVLTNGREVLNSLQLDTEDVTNPSSSDVCVTPLDDIFIAFVSGNDIYVAGYDSDGTIILSPVNISDPTSSVSSISRTPRIFVDSYAKLNILFEDDRAGQFDIYHTRIDQLGAIEVAVNNPSGATSGASGLYIDSDETNNIHITWIEGTTVKYQKIDRDGSVLIATTNISATSYSKQNPVLSTNGNTLISATTGEANGNTTFEDFTTDFITGGVVPGQTLVLTGGDLDYSAIMDGSETEPPAFSAELTGSVSNAVMDTSTASGFNTFTVVVDGVSVAVTFTDTSTNPIATVISEINTESNLTALATNIATNSGSDEVVITSPTTGVSSTVNVTSGNDGIGFTTSDSDQGGTGYNTSVANGTNTIDISIDGTEYNVVFTDTKGNPLATVLSEINTAVGSSVATDGGSIVRITSPTTGLSSIIEIVTGNSSLGFTTSQREEGGSELGSRIGIVTVVDADTLTLASPLRTISTAADVEYDIEAIEATIVWAEDLDIFAAKINDVPSVYYSPTNLTRLEVQASQLAVPTLNTMVNGPGANEITFEDTIGLFITNAVEVGDTLRVTSSTPSSAEADYVIKEITSETELLLTGTLASSPANTVTYTIFKPYVAGLPVIGTNSDNENQIFWVDDNRRINRIELDRTGTVLADNRDIFSQSENITSMDVFVDSSDFSHLTWVQSASNKGDSYQARIDEYGNVSLEATNLVDSSKIAYSISVQVDSENEPIIVWVVTDYSTSPATTTLWYHRRTAQDYYIKVNNPAINMSNLEDRSIIFTKEFLFQPVRINYQTSAGVTTVQDYVTGASEQIIDSNYLVKSVSRAIVTADIIYSGTVTNDQQVVIDYINSVTTENLQASDISDALYDAGATHVQLPFTVYVEYYDIEGRYVKTSSSNEVYIPRTARYLATTDSITVTNAG